MLTLDHAITVLYALTAPPINHHDHLTFVAPHQDSSDIDGDEFIVYGADIETNDDLREEEFA